MGDKNYSASDVQVLCKLVEGLMGKVQKQNQFIEKLSKKPSINLDRLYVSKIEAAWLLGKSPRWIDRLVHEGKLSTVRDSRSIMLPVAELRNLPLVRFRPDGGQFELKIKDL